tara:strand:- start:293 stop:598 length:306 start_codon:yes stop_codon:yes gene_type:complete
MSRDTNKGNLKNFFIKLTAIIFAVIIVINISFNVIFGEKLEKVNKFLSLNNKDDREEIKDKIRSEINKGLGKERILNEEDAELLYKLYIKLKKEIDQTNKN